MRGWQDIGFVLPKRARHAGPKSGLFCQNRRSRAAATTAAHGLRRRLGATAPSSSSKALMAAFRRDSARRS